MALRYFTAHSSQDYGPITFAALSGSSNVLGSIAGNYFTGMSCSIDFVNYYDALVQLSSEMDSLMPGNTTTLRYDFTTSKVIMSSSLNTTWQFQSSSMNLLGFNRQYTNTNVITGTLNPAFIWMSSYEDRSNDSFPFEAKTDFNERLADSGRSYVVGRTATVSMRYWAQNSEPKENVFTEQKDENYTWQEFTRDNRKGPYAFIVIDDTTNTFADYTNRDGTYLLLADRMKFDPEQSLPGYYDYWNINNINTRMLSAPNQLSADQFDALPITSSLLGQQGELLYHMDASAGSKIEVSGSLLKSTQFYDSSKYQNASSIDTTSLMTYNPGNSSIMNGKPIFVFTGSNPHSYTPTVPAGVCSDYVAATTGLAFMANIQLKPYSYNAGTMNIFDIYFIDSTDPNNTFIYSIDTNTNQIKAVAFGQSGASYFEATSSIYHASASDKLMLLTTVDFYTGLSKFYINGIEQGIAAQIGSGMRFTGNTFQFKPSQNIINKKFHTFYLTDFVAYGSKLTTTNLNNLQSYFGNLYDIDYTDIESSGVAVSYFSTPPITANLEFFGDLYSSNTSIVSNAVATIGDSSGKGRHFSQATSAKRPVYTAGDANFGNRSSMTFDGVDDLLVHTATSWSLGNGGTSCTIYVVIRGGTMGRITCPGANPSALIIRSGANYINSMHWETSATQKLTYVDATAPIRHASVFDTTVGATAIPKAYLNGTDTLAGYISTSGTGGNLATTTHGIGAAPWEADFFNGTITDILIYSVQHTAAEVAQMDTWLKIRNNL